MRTKHIFPVRWPVAPILGAALACVLLTDKVRAADPGGTLKVFCDDPRVLATSKAALATGDATLRPALDQLLADADELLKKPPVSVMLKSKTPPSGDKHDYVSQAPYFWRDTNSPDGKYVNRDGQKNPEAGANTDAGNFSQTCSDSHTLALAYYFSGDEKYAAKAVEFIRVWFLDPGTRMNPNLKYGQAIPGSVEGRPAGLITARCLASLVDAIGLLAGSKTWTTNDQRGMEQWADDYFKWLTTSKIGLGEDAASNNHGTYYDVQAVSLALFLDKTDFAREKLLAARESRIARQIKPDGGMPRELARTLSFNYSLFNLRAELQLAALGRNVGVDLWHYQSPDGGSIPKAAEFMAQFANPDHAWPYHQIEKPNRKDLGMTLLLAAPEIPDDKIQDALKYFRAEDFSNCPERLYSAMARLPAEKQNLTALPIGDHASKLQSE